MGVAVLLNYLFQDKLLFALIAVILGAEIISWSSIAVAHLRFRARLKATGSDSKYRSPFTPVANYVCLAYFALLIVLMGFLPDYRIGLLALPAWVIVLLLIWLGQRGHQQKLALRLKEDAHN